MIPNPYAPSAAGGYGGGYPPAPTPPSHASAYGRDPSYGADMSGYNYGGYAPYGNMVPNPYSQSPAAYGSYPPPTPPPHSASPYGESRPYGQAAVAAAENAKKDIREIQVRRSDKVCDFWLSARGCVKGMECDFAHPAGGRTADKKPPPSQSVCEFWGTARGCVKGQNCDFLHPEGKVPPPLPDGSPAPPVPFDDPSRICQFSKTAKGCIKGDTCEFYHPPGSIGNRRPCVYYFSPRGCVKGTTCDFSHAPESAAWLPPEAGRSALQNMPPQRASAYGYPPPPPHPQSSYYYPPPPPSRGGYAPYPPSRRPPTNAAPASVLQVCEFFNSERGCKKGVECDFQHVRSKEQLLAVMPPQQSHNGKPCTFWESGKGCRKGDKCDFSHQGTPGIIAEATGRRRSASPPRRRDRSASPTRNADSSGSAPAASTTETAPTSAPTETSTPTPTDTNTSTNGTEAQPSYEPTSTA